MVGVEGDRLDRFLNSEAHHMMGDEEVEGPLVLLVATGCAECEVARAVAEHQGGAECGAWTFAGRERVGVSLGEPCHLAARAKREPEAGHRRRTLQPSTTGSRDDEVSFAVGDA